MKIMDASISLASRHSLEKLEVSVDEKSGKQKISPSASGRLALGSTAADMPSILVDRVSISHSLRHASQFNFQSEIQSGSRVLSGDGTTVQTFQNQELVQTLVGAVIDKDVTAGHLRIGQPVSLLSDRSGGGAAITASGGSGEWQMALTRTDIRYEDEQMGFSSFGTVHTEDGRTIEFSLELALERTYLSETEQSTLVHKWQEQVNLTDPLMVSLDGGLPSLSDTTFEFDLNGDGQTESVHFAGQGTGFLSFDKNADGVINDGSELFGPGTGNGFGELSAYDDDGNNWIDENDAVFEKLSVWMRDENGEDRLVSLKDAGIGAIALDHAATRFDVTGTDNTLRGRVQNSGVFLFENGNVGAIQQVDLADVRPSEGLETVDATRIPDMPRELNSAVSISPAAATMPSAGSVENPLEQLLEKIKELKREMDRILGKAGAGRSGMLSGKSGSRRARGASFQLYQMIAPDSFMGFGEQNRQRA